MEQYLVFDIETAPVAWESLSESQQEYILRKAETEEEKQQKKFEMALSPMTAHVACIGLQLMERASDGWEMKNRKAFSSELNFSEEEKKEVIIANNDKCQISDEIALLNDFWSILKKYPNAQLVSFNGRNFDAPFLMLRSAIFGIKPSRNIMSGTKFNYSMHIDLIDELSFYQMTYGSGATRRFNFDFYTRVFGIKSPKSEGVDGSMVGEMYHANKIIEIAEYCMRDINATWELFLKWYNYLKF